MNDKMYDYESHAQIDFNEGAIFVTGFSNSIERIGVGESRTFEWGSQFKFNKDLDVIEIFNPEGDKVGEAPFDQVVHSNKSLTIAYHG